MKIGFDAKRAFNNFTGLGNYSRTLIETLVRYFPENDYHLFTPKIPHKTVFNAVEKLPKVVTHTPPQYLRYFKALWRSVFIKKDINKAKIDIFHGLSHELPLFLPKNVKTVVTMHDLIHERYPEFYSFFDRQIYRFKFKRACQQADVVVAISEQTKRDIVDLYKIEAAKIKVIYQSCHTQFYLTPPSRLHRDFVPQQYDTDFLNKKYNLPEKYVLYVGTVNERKNLLSLVKAMQMLDFQDNTHLVVVGNGGKYFNMVKNYVSTHQLTNQVLFLTKIEFSDLPYLYQKARVFVLPSFFEGFGIPIIEALWSGCPVITSEGSCFAEAGGANSLYINPNSVESIAGAIKQVLTDKTLQEQMILRGRQYVEKFHEKQIGEEWMELYSSLK